MEEPSAQRTPTDAHEGGVGNPNPNGNSNQAPERPSPTMMYDDRPPARYQGHHPYQQNQFPEGPTEGSFPVGIVGGFGLGVFCLAALRWLNGGDFVLFPPPTARHDGCNAPDSDGEETGNEMYNREAPEDLPSYGELVSEIRSLATVVDSYRAERERANRVVVGRGVTDDVMDFLREEKVRSEGGGTSGEMDVAFIRSTLGEISDDLILLKQRVLAGRDKRDDSIHGTDSETISGKEDGETSNEKLPIDEAGLLAIIDGSIAKVENIINMVQIPSAGDNTASLDEEPTDSPPEEGTFNVHPEADAHHPFTTSDDPPHEDSDSTEKDVEEALQILSNSNNEEELKTGAQMLYLYCRNISKSPEIPHYRKIHTKNSTYQEKVGNLKGAKELLCALGFTENTNFFEWTKSANHSMETKSSLDLALVVLDRMRGGTNLISRPEEYDDLQLGCDKRPI